MILAVMRRPHLELKRVQSSRRAGMTVDIFSIRESLAPWGLVRSEGIWRLTTLALVTMVPLALWAAIICGVVELWP
jgi:hypothetical protein